MKQGDPLVRVIKYHEQVSEYLENVKGIMDFLEGEQTWERLNSMEDFFERNIIGHFRFEEKMVFPICLIKAATPKIVSLILELQREHGDMLAKVEEFRRIKSQKDDPLGEKIRTKLEIIGRELFDKLLAHTSKEDDELVPILEENRNIFDL